MFPDINTHPIENLKLFITAIKIITKLVWTKRYFKRTALNTNNPLFWNEKYKATDDKEFHKGSNRQEFIL